MPCYEGKPNPNSKDATKRKPTPMPTPTPTPIFTISDDSSDISASDDSLLGTDHNTNFRYPVPIDEDEDLPDSEDGIVLYMHDISYMREAVKQAEKEEENASTIESSDIIVVDDDFAEAGTSSNSSSRVQPTGSLMNLLENDSGEGSTTSLTVRAAAAARSAADYGEIYIPRPSSH